MPAQRRLGSRTSPAPAKKKKIGAKLNQSILEMALVRRCQGERLRERDQAGAGRQGPGGRHRRRSAARALPASHGAHQPRTVGMGASSCYYRGAEQDGVPSSESRALSRLCYAVPQFPRTEHLVPPTKEGGEPQEG